MSLVNHMQASDNEHYRPRLFLKSESAEKLCRSTLRLCHTEIQIEGRL